MTKEQVQRKMAQFIKIGNELDAEAKRRYGPTGMMFHECEGGIFLMSGDCDGNNMQRQKYVEIANDKGSARWGTGAW